MSSGSAAPNGARHRARDWVAEYEALTDRARTADLSCEELERLAEAAFLTGRDGEVTELRRRAFDRYLADDEPARAGRCAFWLGFHLDNSGQHAQAAGWLAKLERLTDEHPAAFEALRDLLDLGRAGHLMFGGRFADALPLFESGRQHARRRGDLDAAILGGVGSARCTELLGRPQAAIALFDEVMVDVVAQPVAPQLVGLAYCSVIAMCMRYLDIGRAREWTQALTHWCDDQSGLVPYRGACVVHRAELLQVQGSWERAEAVAAEAGRPPADAAVAGPAHYRLAEILRLRGRLAAAEQEYRAAARFGFDVQPGLARLRAAQGRLAAARSALDRVGAEDAQDAGPSPTPALHAARVEIALLSGDLDTARRALQALEDTADGAAPYLRALADHAAGSLLLAQGEPGRAAMRLRRAATAWVDLEAPYECARTRMLLADAYRALGDADAAAMERQAALDTLDRLGAAVDAAAIQAPRGTGLTRRETQVLCLLATGATNRSIARELTLSEKTVARHISNIYGKLGINSRAAATAYAYEHHLAGPAGHAPG